MSKWEGVVSGTRGGGWCQASREHRSGARPRPPAPAGWRGAAPGTLVSASAFPGDHCPTLPPRPSLKLARAVLLPSPWPCDSCRSLCWAQRSESVSWPCKSPPLAAEALRTPLSNPGAVGWEPRVGWAPASGGGASTAQLTPLILDRHRSPSAGLGPALSASPTLSPGLLPSGSPGVWSTGSPGAAVCWPPGAARVRAPPPHIPPPLSPRGPPSASVCRVREVSVSRRT